MIRLGIQKTTLFVLGALLLIYVASRLTNIMTVPIFTDEAIYTRWSQIARFDANWRFISLTDGKQPSFVWADMILMRFVEDPLLAGRLVSMFAGAAALIGLFFLGREVFKSTRVGIFASLLYVVYPFALVYDRMALYDSLVAAFMVWALYLEVLLVRRLRLDISLILGMVVGGGILTKTNAFFAIYLLPFSLLLFDWKKKGIRERLVKWAGLAAVSVVIAYTMYSVQRLSPFFHIIDEKNAIFVYPLREWIEHPLRFFWGNLSGQFNWLWEYFTLPGLALVLLALGLQYKKFVSEKLLLLVWFSAPFVALALFGKTLYPRFILFMTMPLLILAAFALAGLISRIKNNLQKVVIVLLFVAMMIRSDYHILFNFQNAPIPFLDLEQFINGWPAGGGIKETLAFLEKESQKGKIFVAAMGDFGSLPKYSLEIYQGDNTNIERRDPGIYPIPPTIPEDIAQKATQMPTYIFFSNQNEFLPNIKNWPLEQLFEYQKGTGNSYTRLYRVIPQE